MPITLRSRWRRLACALALGTTAFVGWSGAAADYHLDAQEGHDHRDGRTPSTAWRSLERVNDAALGPGDRVLFRAGGVWSGQLRLTTSGEPDRPITVRAYGSGPRPRIDAGGAFEDTVLIRNAQCVEVYDLELTNRGEGGDEALRRGVHVVAADCGTLTNLVVSGLFIHDVNGTQRRKDNGGILFRTQGRRVPSRFDGLRIERNILWRVDRSGIAAQSDHASRNHWFPSLRVRIRDNWVGDVGGDGIVPWATEGCVVEHNIVAGANERAGTYNAGIWPWSTDHTVLRLNRAYGVKTLMDGQGFDSDFNCRGTVLEFNLSHDNDGGFLLICTPGRRNEDQYLGNDGTVARFNISRHDGARTFHVSAATNTRVERNAIYVGRGQEVQGVLLSDWSGWADGLTFADNLFHSEGLIRYGHQVSRSEDGSYGLGPGWGPATRVVFRGNRFVGPQENAPEDSEPPGREAPTPIDFEDWPGPQWDPRGSADFDTFLTAHRAWMLRLMERQFGKQPGLGD